MKNKWKGFLSKEIPLSALKKTLALLLAVLMVVTSGDFTGLYPDGVVKAEGTSQNTGNAKFSIEGAFYDQGGPHSASKDLPLNVYTDNVNERSVLGDAWNYGITANTWMFNGEAETNFAVKKLTGVDSSDPSNVKEIPLNGGQTGIDDKAQGSQCGQAIAGEVNGQTSIKNYPLSITAPESEQKKLTSNGDAWIRFVTDTQDNINNKIDKMTRHVKDQCETLSGKDSIIDYSQVLRGRDNALTLDFTSDSSLKPNSNSDEKKTIYINVDNWKVHIDDKGNYWTLSDAIKNNGQLTIKKYSNQVLVFNFSGSDITLNKIMVEDYFPDGTKFSGNTVDLANTSTGKTDVGSTLIFNMPKATTVNLTDSCGIFLAPSATVTFHGVDGGWLVADTAISDAEWHFVNGKLPDTFNSESVKLEAKKTVEGKEPGEKQFNFSLYQKKMISGIS